MKSENSPSSARNSWMWCTMAWLLLQSTVLAVHLQEESIDVEAPHLERHHRLLAPIEGRPRALFEQAQVIKEAIDPKLGTDLTLLLLEQEFNGDSPDVRDESNILVVDIAFSAPLDNDQAASILGSVQGLEVINCQGHLCSSLVPITSLVALAQIDAVRFLHQASGSTAQGSVTSEGGAAMYSDIASLQYLATGKGIRIGVISDAYNTLRQAADDIQSGDLPSRNNIKILRDPSFVRNIALNYIDEGRAMMQLIHDVAPGAQLAFRDGLIGQADFARGIQALAAAGADVIVDDVYFYKEPFFQDGLIAQAIDKVVAEQGIPYFAAAGNFAQNSWEAPAGFDSITVNGTLFHKFGTDETGAPIISQRITMRNTDFAQILVFQWDNPFYSVSGSPGAQSDLDIILIINGVIVASGSDQNIGNDPVEQISFITSEWSTNTTVTVEFGIINSGGPAPTFLKLVVYGSRTSFEFSTNSGAAVGHSVAAKGAGVGAAYWNNTPAFGVSPPRLERFSSVGGSYILFDTEGNRLPSPEIRQQPRFVGPDGTATTFFGENDGSAFRFYGTSAAAPHVAAVAALLLELKGGPKSLTPSEIYSILETTAIDMDNNFTDGFDSGYDFATGWGFVNASEALNSLGLPPLPPTPAPVCGFLGLGLLCPFSQCGVFGRLLGLCAN